jgi:hypothetical protein
VKDLQHCALVCRAWLRPSRTNLLRNPIISSSSQYDGLWALLNADPTLDTAVRTIITCDGTAVLTELAPGLPNLTTLSLGALSWSPTDVGVHRSLRLPSSLSDLSLNGCTFASCTAFAALLAMVPALRSLECDYIKCDFSEEDAAVGEGLFASPVVLAELAIKDLRKAMPDAAILALGRLLRPHKLTWGPRSVVDILYFRALCKHSGTFISDFHAMLEMPGKPPTPFRESSCERRKKVPC